MKSRRKSRRLSPVRNTPRRNPPRMMHTSMRAKARSRKVEAKVEKGKSSKQNCRQACSNNWRPDGSSLGHHCPKYHPRRQPVCGSTRHYTSQCQRPVKPKAKNAEYEDDSTWHTDSEWPNQTWETEEYETSKGKKRKGMGGLGQKGSQKGRASRDPLLLDLLKPRIPDQTDLRPSPSLKPDHARQMDYLFAMMSTKLKPTWWHTTWNSTDYMVCTVAEPQKKLTVFKPGKWTIDDQCKTRHVQPWCQEHEEVHFALRERTDQCESLDRLWFGQVWLPVEKYACDVQYAQAQDSILDPSRTRLTTQTRWARIVLFTIKRARPSVCAIW